MRAAHPTGSSRRSSGTARRVAVRARAAASSPAGPVTIGSSGATHAAGSTLSVGRSPGACARVDRDHHPVLGEVQRAEQRAGRVAEVVPRPGELRARLLDRVVVADDAAVDAANAERLQRVDPAARGRRRRGRRSTDRRSRRRSGRRGDCRRRSAPLPARRSRTGSPSRRLGGGGQADELRGRRGHEQRARIQLEEPLVAIERLDDDAPGGALRRRAACVAAVMSCLSCWSGSRVGAGCRRGRLARSRSRQQRQSANRQDRTARAAPRLEFASCHLHLDLHHYFNASTALIASSNGIASIFAAPGSSVRLRRRRCRIGRT